MRKTGKMLAAAMAGVMALSMAGCSGNTGSGTESGSAAPETKQEASSEGKAGEGASDSGEEFKIGVLQLTQHTALDKVNEGFVSSH